MIEISLCEHMHWTHDQFIDQPTWFIEALVAKLSLDGERQKKLARKG